MKKEKTQKIKVKVKHKTENLEHDDGLLRLWPCGCLFLSVTSVFIYEQREPSKTQTHTDKHIHTRIFCLGVDFQKYINLPS